MCRAICDSLNPKEKRHWLTATQIFLAGFLICNRAFLCATDSKDRETLEYVLTYVQEISLSALYLLTGFMTILFLSGRSCSSEQIVRTGKTFGSNSEHSTATVLAIFIIISEIIKVILLAESEDDEDSMVPIAEGIRMGTLIFFTFTNIFYVWHHARLPKSGAGKVHQAVHLSLSLYIAFHAEFREVEHIKKHIDNPHRSSPGNDLKGSLLMETLAVFFYALNFEFHILLANYAFLIFKEQYSEEEPHFNGAEANRLIDCANTKNFCQKVFVEPRNNPSTVAVSLSSFFSLLALVVAVALYLSIKKNFLFYWGNDWTGVIVVFIFFLMTVLSIRVWKKSDYARNSPRPEDAHENKVLCIAAIGLLLYNLCGFLYSLQMIFEYEKVHDKERNTMIGCVISLFITIFSNLQMLFQTTYMIKCDHHITKSWRDCKFWLASSLCLLNGLQVTIDLIDMFEAGIHDSPLSEVGSRNFLIFTRALSSFGVFYRLASFFRFAHILEHETHHTDDHQCLVTAGI